MKPSPLRLEGYFLRELTVEVNPKFEKKHGIAAWMGFHYQPDEPYEPDLISFEVSGFAASKKGDPARRMCLFTIDSDRGPRKKFPYSFRITIEGYFEISENCPAESADLLFYANAPALLYGAAREILAIVTGRGPYPAVVLPSVSFLDDAKSMIPRLPQETKQLSAKKASKKTSKKGSKK